MHLLTWLSWNCWDDKMGQAQLYLKDRAKHDQTAREWVQKYGT